MIKLVGFFRLFILDFLYHLNRNEIWRYSRKEWGTERWRIASLITFGWKWAIPMLALTAIYEYTIKKNSDNEHAHH